MSACVETPSSAANVNFVATAAPVTRSLASTLSGNFCTLWAASTASSARFCSNPLFFSNVIFLASQESFVSYGHNFFVGGR